MPKNFHDEFNRDQADEQDWADNANGFNYACTMVVWIGILSLIILAII